MDDLASAVTLLRAAGYLVFKIPDCKKDKSHGSHIILTKSVRCPGVNPPHGYHSAYEGIFGTWINCQCGYQFSDYDGDPKTDWEEHKEEYNIDK